MIHLLVFLSHLICASILSAQTPGSCDRSLETKQKTKTSIQLSVSYDPSMVTALQRETWMDAEGFKKTCIKENRKRGGIRQPLYSTWAVDFMLRQNAGRLMLGKYVSDKNSQKFQYLDDKKILKITWK